jgi:3-dehydroquinate dehydratase/shikimate dehydrogenase
MIILSITGPSMATALQQVKSGSRYADILEFRLDMIGNVELTRLFSSTRKPRIVTCRPVREGGRFAGRESDRIEILEGASLLGAEYVDIEYDAGAAAIRSFVLRRLETSVIVSKHIFSRSRFHVPTIYRQLHATGADVIKFAFMADDAADIGHAFEFLALARADRRKAIAIAMGEAGEASRILYRCFGGWASYASVDAAEGAAPGQVPARDLRLLYRAHSLTPRTRIFGVVGNPVRQSKGIYVHNAVFQKSGTNAVYCRFRVRDLGRFVRAIVPFMGGCSVTLPHKESIGRHLDSIEPVARAIGAVNTVYRKNGKLTGTNTDASAALDAIEDVSVVHGKDLLIVGAGGAARAVAYEARQRGARVLIANRTDARARRLAAGIGAVHVKMADLVRQPFDILVNATSVGMFPAVHATPVPAEILAGKIVFDAVYNPPLTRLLRDARKVGGRTVAGTAMYINQAARQSKLFTGKEPDLRLMRRVFQRHG